MVRKGFLLACIVVLLVSLAGAATANETYWIVKFRTGFNYGANMVGYSTATIGAGTTAQNVPASDPLPTVASIAAGTGGPTYWNTERRLASSSPPPQTFYLTVAVGGSYFPLTTPPHQNEVFVTAWSPNSYQSVPGRSIPSYWIVLVRSEDLGTTYAIWTYGDLFLPTDPVGSAPGNVGFWFTPIAPASAWQDPVNTTFAVTIEPPMGAPPTVSISSPTDLSTYTTALSSIDIAGTASGDYSITSVTWFNSAGGSGTCSGTTFWSASGIALQPGENVITVTAYDAVGSSGSDTITVTCDQTPPGPASSFTATPGDQQVALAWSNPGDTDFAGVKIMFKTTGYPTGPADGAQVYDSNGTSTTHTGLTNGVTYYYAAYAHDAVLNYASAAQASGAPASASPPETVIVADPGNTADTRYATPGYGAVNYVYRIGKYEVTTAQYVEFLNHKAQSDPYGLWNSGMADPTWGCNIQRSGISGSYSYSVGSGSSQDVAAWGNRPVNYVVFWDACRFANWLNNGQGNGDTETGAYTLTTDGITNNTITRNAGANWAVASEDEWYKAAYYKGGGTSAGYWDYATQSDTVPANQVLPADPGNSADYYNNGHTIGSPYYRTNVGEFENSASAYGTFDQAGNVWEWNDRIIGVSQRGMRGGSFADDYHALQASNVNAYYGPGWVNAMDGFRVAAFSTPATPPSVGITSPTSSPTYATALSSINIAGTATQGDNPISSVTWANDRGGSGTCSGTTSWSASGVSLQLGQNIITVTAHDTVSATGSDTITVTRLDTTPPANVTGFTVTPGDTQNSLSWINPGDVDFAGVKILFKTSGYPTGPTDGAQCYDATGTSATHSSLTNGTTYYYAAFAYDAVPNYASGAQASGVPADTTPPGPASSFTATPGGQQVALAWTNPTDADFAGVKILFKTSGYPASPTDGALCYTGTGTSTVHDGLTNGATYYYCAFAYDEVPNYASGVTASGVPFVAQMIYIPAGSFLMGNSGVGDDAVYYYSEELPQHSVNLPAYWIGKYEVTRGEYAQFMNAGGYSNPAYWSSDGWSWKVSNGRTQPTDWDAVQDWGTTFTQTDNHPVIGVTYCEAEAFCNWAGGHLPTEAQWEKAARWNAATSHPNVFPWGDTWDQEKCNNSYDSNPAGGGYGAHQTAPVGSYPSGASPYGCQDMAGNVWEWCQDWYVSYPGSSSPFDHTGTVRALRGGSWGSYGYDYASLDYRCAHRGNGLLGNYWSHGGGFRVVASYNAPPAVEITSPTSSPTYATALSSINIAGTATEGDNPISSVTWANSAGGSGTCSGTASWSASGVSLQPGENIITVTAHDTVGATGSDTLTVNSDRTLPIVTIKLPTEQTTFSTTQSMIFVNGLASDNVAVASVSWANDRGGSGDCTGKTLWTTGNFPLQMGANVITITATDTVGNVGSDQITVTRTDPFPLVSGFSPASGLAGMSVTISGLNFTGATEVRFNGAPAETFTVGDSTEITATVPADASTGPISVVTPYGTAAGSGNFVVEHRPENDNCGAALEITSNPYTNTQETGLALGENDQSMGCDPTAGYGVWYKYTAPTTPSTGQRVVAHTYGSSFETTLAAYAGTCGAFTEVACNETGPGSASRLDFEAGAGATYYIQVAGKDHATGSLTFSLHADQMEVHNEQPAPGSGNFDDLQWPNEQVPGSNTNVVIQPPASGTTTITVDSSVTVNSLTVGDAPGQGSVEISIPPGVELVVSNNITVGSGSVLSVAGGSLTVEGTLENRGELILGSQAAAGSTQLVSQSASALLSRLRARGALLSGRSSVGILSGASGTTSETPLVNITGGFNGQPGSKLTVVTASSDFYGRMTVRGQAKLTGVNLNMQMLNGFVPPPNCRYPVMVVNHVDCVGGCTNPICQICPTCGDGVCGSFGEITVAPALPQGSFTVAVERVGSVDTCYVTSLGTTAHEPPKVGEVKQLPLADAVLGTVILVQSASNCFYIQDSLGAGGIRVDTTTTGQVIADKAVQAGDCLQIDGTIVTKKIGSVDSERQIVAGHLTRLTRAAPNTITPLGMSCRAVGGGSVPAMCPGVLGGIGVNNIGMLARVFGRVVHIDGSMIALDDSSYVWDPLGTSVDVQLPTGSPTLGIGDFVSVVGVIQGNVPSGWTANRRFIAPRSPNDVVLILRRH